MTKPITIAIDAMGGEDSPKKIIDGIEIALNNNKEYFFQLYGNSIILKEFLNKKKHLKSYCEVFDSKNSIADDESPLAAAKKGNSTSMWAAIESQLKNDAQITLSAGNTGALLVISRLVLKMLNGVDKPALAGLWPNKNNVNVVLDLGANIECNEKHLTDFCNMGAALYKSLFPEDVAKVGLLNVGSEENKGNEILKKTYSILKENSSNDYIFSGYIEGNEIMNGDMNVIVTDGFTGNIALKTAEGTSRFLTTKLKEVFSNNIIAKLGMLLAYSPLKKFKEKLDPRKYNGAIFLGLNGPVVKSHGSTDALGFSYSIEMCDKIIRGNLINKINKNLNSIDLKRT
ncbi:MAG: phosphate acyltransferase [Candidatus Pelagibacter sp. TMED64]|nr:phosphate acyltransferase [Candidatus Pelagibacter sp.]OUU64890.1 MAG: phosphate acyltransferase [Candidatus Pelagibacter sp. TMED64]